MANALNGQDFETFGLYFQKESTDGFLLYPDRKDSTSHDFETEDGLDIDLDAPKFKAREFTVHCAMIAKGATIAACFANFWQQHDGLFTELSKPGLHHFYIADHQRTYDLYYLKMTTVKKLSQISNLLKVGMTFDLVLTETNPFQNIGKVYLVDHTGRFLVC